MNQLEILCGDLFYSCTCHEPAEHATDHRCRCGGEWSEDHEVVTLPDLVPFDNYPDACDVTPPIAVLDNRTPTS